MKQYILLSILFSLFVYSGFSQTDGNALAQKVANAYGIKDFKKAKSMSFTFNVKRDTFPITYRSWDWNMEKNIVTMKDPKQTVTYRRDTIQSAAMKNIDGKFINDQYWLLFPFHIVMDKGCTLTEKDNVKAPIGKTNSTMLMYNITM